MAAEFTAFDRTRAFIRLTVLKGRVDHLPIASWVLDPGIAICAHENRVHPLGGGLFVCFGCWTRLLVGAAV